MQALQRDAIQVQLGETSCSHIVCGHCKIPAHSAVAKLAGACAGLSLLTRACLMLRLEDAKAGLLYSQYHGVLAACTAQPGSMKLFALSGLLPHLYTTA